MVIFEVLGPVRARRDDDSTLAPTGLQALLLSILVSHPEQVVPADRLIDALWGSTADERAAHRLQTHVHRLRQALGAPTQIAADSGGYRLILDGASVDADRFQDLLTEAHTASESGEHELTASLCRQALRLWRGEPFQNLEADMLAPVAHRLQDQRISVQEQLCAADLACGRHQSVTDLLSALVEEHPLRERLHELLMVSHAMAGRQAEALSTFRRARAVLIDELGIEPGPRLRELQGRLLAGEEVSLAATRPFPDSSPVPAQLPARPRGFIGRDDALQELTDWLHDASDPASLFTVTGGAGVGKTALTLHWAHGAAAGFPDGQLYTDLRGYGPDHPVEPHHVLAGFLRALGVEGARIPDVLEERAALFRSKMAGRRTLMVLDNARDVGQVRPLLPGTSASSVLVTSRNVLTGLSVQEGAHQVALGPLAEDESRRLIIGLLGPGASDIAVDEFARACAHLPLALRIAAERVRSMGAGDLTEQVVELREGQERLDRLDAGDERSSVRGAFWWSYRDLEEQTSWLFRCFGIAPSHELGLAALAALADLDERSARRGIEELRRAHLVQTVSRDRFTLHDLLRSYAIELTDGHDSEQVRQDAFSRLCQHYLRMSAVTMTVRMPHQVNLPDLESLAAEAPVSAGQLEVDSARRWLKVERGNLIITAEEATRRGHQTFSPRLSEIIWRDLDHDEARDSAVRLHASALLSAQAASDTAAEGTAHRRLAITALDGGHMEEVEHHALTALELHAASHALGEIAADHDALGAHFFYTRRLSEAREQFEKSARAHEELGDPRGGCAMANAGLLHQRLGHPGEGLQWLEKALLYSQEHHQVFDEANTRVNLATVARDLGDDEAALVHAAHGLRLARTLGALELEGFALTEEGAVLCDRGELSVAQQAHRQALDVAAAHHIPDLASEARNGLGEVARAAGDHRLALVLHRKALEVPSEYWYEKARGHMGLGESYRGLGASKDAAEAWRMAAEIYEEVGHAHADRLRSTAESLDGGSGEDGSGEDGSGEDGRTPAPPGPT